MTWVNLNDVYVPKTGGTITGALTVNGNLTINDGTGNGTTYNVANEITSLRDSVSQTTLWENNNAPHGSCRVNINTGNNTHQLYGTACVLSSEWGSVWNAAVKCPGISDSIWYIKTNFKVQTPSKAYSVPCSGIFLGGFSDAVYPENFNNAIYYVGTDGYIYIPLQSSKPTTTFLWFFWGRVADENIV